MLAAQSFISDRIAGGEDFFRKMDRPGRVRTRQAVDLNHLATQYSRTNLRKFSFRVRVVDSWNRLDQIRVAVLKGENSIQKSKVKFEPNIRIVALDVGEHKN
jgi:hypothetical protein